MLNYSFNGSSNSVEADLNPFCVDLTQFTIFISKKNFFLVLPLVASPPPSQNIISHQPLPLLLQPSPPLRLPSTPLQPRPQLPLSPPPPLPSPVPTPPPLHLPQPTTCPPPPTLHRARPLPLRHLLLPELLPTSRLTRHLRMPPWDSRPWMRRP